MLFIQCLKLILISICHISWPARAALRWSSSSTQYLPLQPLVSLDVVSMFTVRMSDQMPVVRLVNTGLTVRFHARNEWQDCGMNVHMVPAKLAGLNPFCTFEMHKTGFLTNGGTFVFPNLAFDFFYFYMCDLKAYIVSSL